MKRTTKDFIVTALCLIVAAGVVSTLAVNFIELFDLAVYISNMLFTLVGYFWCLHTHSKVINSEKH
jgi:hypothetical protein